MSRKRYSVEQIINHLRGGDLQLEWLDEGPVMMTGPAVEVSGTAGSVTVSGFGGGGTTGAVLNPATGFGIAAGLPRPSQGLGGRGEIRPRRLVAAASLTHAGVEGMVGGQMADFEGGDEATVLADLVDEVVGRPGQDDVFVDAGHLVAVALSAEEQQSAGVTDDLIRVSVGIEHIEDIIADIEQALAAAAT